MSGAALDLTRTRAALAAYDKAGDRVDAASEPAELGVALALYNAAGLAVRDAFALDTADRNRPEVARLASIEWIRSLV